MTLNNKSGSASNIVEYIGFTRASFIGRVAQHGAIVLSPGSNHEAINIAKNTASHIWGMSQLLESVSKGRIIELVPYQAKPLMGSDD